MFPQAEAERNGLLSWSDIAMSQFKLKVAEEFELGPSRIRKRAVRNAGKEDGAAAAPGSGDMDIVAEKESPSKPGAVPGSAAASAAAAASSSSRNSSAEWAAMRCPLFSAEGDVVSKVDVMRNLNKKCKLRSGGGYYAEQMGNSLYRAKLNLGSKTQE
jgi:hypothetical protein